MTIQVPKQNRRSLIYVALSRATKLQNLFLVGTKFHKPIPPDEDDKVVKEMDRLRREAALIPLFAHLHEVPTNAIQIVSQNIRSLQPHINTIKCDPVFIKSQFILMQETWISSQIDINSINIPEKVISSRNMLSSDGARGKGTLIYSANSVRISNAEHFDRSLTCPIDLTVCATSKLTIINMYRSSKTTANQLSAALSKIENYLRADNVLLCGDFNDEIHNPENNTRRILEQCSLKLLSPKEPTTDNSTTIDGVFGKLEDYSVNVYIYESYNSDHKPIVVRLEENEPQSTGLSQTIRLLNV